MRKVDRSNIPPPPCLEKRDASGLTERERAEQFYAKKSNRNKPFPGSYSAYKCVKDTLDKVFYKKCAYCENKYGMNQPVDVEHFRPKGGVIINNKVQSPGYFWLAAEWENLLPSCIFCNRRNKHMIPGVGQQTQGKGNYFPIKDENKRASKPGEEDLEERLLIHPCVDDPSEHLEFRPNGAVEAKTEMGATSIRIYALNRDVIQEARAMALNSFLANMELVKERMSVLYRDRQNGELRQKFADALYDLMEMIAEKQVFLGIKHQFLGNVPDAIRQFLRQFLPDVVDDAANQDPIRQYLARYPRTPLDAHDNQWKLSDILGQDG